ncbi:hypothetical protein D3C85_1369410 [compost metagenome]
MTMVTLTSTDPVGEIYTLVEALLDFLAANPVRTPRPSKTQFRFDNNNVLREIDVEAGPILELVK